MSDEEDKLHIWLRSKLCGSYTHVQRVESSTSAGIPDVNICNAGIECWVELKIKLKQGVLLRKEQYAWGVRRSRSGGRCFVLVGGGENIEIHRYPNVKVIPYSGYLLIVSEPDDVVKKTVTGGEILGLLV